MENQQPTFLDLLLEAHIDLNRQGPGSPETMQQALSFLSPLDRLEQIADLGCGTGGQTLELAEHLQGHIVGLDMFPDFASRLTAEAQKRGFGSRVSGIVGNMESLPFALHSLDLIWSEGAIDNIGFEHGLRHWHDFLKPGGCLAVTCPSWLTLTRPAVVEQFWSEAGSHLDTVEKNIEIMQQAGYQFLAAFALPEACWTDNYFTPRAAAIEKLMKKYPDSDVMKQYAAVNQQEVDLYLQYKQHYGYVFYIGRAV